MTDLRAAILADPAAVLEDPAVMAALTKAAAAAEGRNVVDLRSVQLSRLETRLGRLENAHEGVLAAAQEILAGVHQVHQAVLSILEPTTFEGFLTALSGEVADVLSVDIVRIALEMRGEGDGAALGPAGPTARTLVSLAPGGIRRVLTGTGPLRPATLRTSRPAPPLWSPEEHWVRSEALVRLDLGPDLPPALLVFGAEDPDRFPPDLGHDLLIFLGGVTARALCRWLV